MKVGYKLVYIHHLFHQNIKFERILCLRKWLISTYLFNLRFLWIRLKDNRRWTYIYLKILHRLEIYVLKRYFGIYLDPWCLFPPWSRSVFSIGCFSGVRYTTPWTNARTGCETRRTAYPADTWTTLSLPSCGTGGKPATVQTLYWYLTH